MSASALFEFDTKRDIKDLFKKLVQIWKKNRPDRDVSIANQHNHQVHFDSHVPKETEKEFVRLMKDKSEEMIKEIVDEINQKYEVEIDEHNVDIAEKQIKPISSKKEWLCLLCYYYDSDEEDKDDFLSAVKEIYEFAKADIYYFRDPEYFDEFYGCGGNKPPDMLIFFTDVLKYSPKMIFDRRYVIQKLNC